MKDSKITYLTDVALITCVLFPVVIRTPPPRCAATHPPVN